MMRRGQSVACRTQEQYERLRKAGFDVTFIASSPSSRRSAPRAPRAPAGQDNPEVIALLHEDLRSTSLGASLGKKWQHNPFALAASLGLPIEFRPLAELQNSSRPSITILGRLVKIPGQSHYIQLADSLGGEQTHKTLSHELAHALGIENERHADQFSQAFMTVHDDETAGGRWNLLQQDLLARARQDATARHKSLQAAASRRY